MISPEEKELSTLKKMNEHGENHLVVKLAGKRRFLARSALLGEREYAESLERDRQEKAARAEHTKSKLSALRTKTHEGNGQG